MNATEMHDKLKNVSSIFEGHLNKIRELNNEGFHDEAIILTVTISEVILKDIFIIYKDDWFTYESSIIYEDSIDYKLENETRVNHKTKIRKYLESIRAYDDFIKNYYVYQQTSNPEIESIYQTLFKNGKSKINFQDLTKGNDNSAINAYDIFFGMDLAEMFDINKDISERNLSLTVRLFKDRHKIIHTGSSTTLKIAEIEKVISSLEYLKTNLLNKFRQYTIMSLDRLPDYDQITFVQPRDNNIFDFDML